MTLVRIVGNWDEGGMVALTPGCSGTWDDIRFTEDEVDSCDYLVVINHPMADVTVRCPPDRVWGLMMEPPNEYFGPFHHGDRAFSRVYTSDERLRGPRYRHLHPCLPWQIDKTYDELVGAERPAKDRALSWVTSNKGTFKGHKARLRFLGRLRTAVEFDLFGRGFRPLADKWDGIAPYRYSLAIENFVGPWYWTEKLSDCFLAWTMPVYYGCPRIADYFPEESFVRIDIEDPDAPRQIREVVESRRWERSLDAIEHARNLALERYHFFPVMAREIHRNQQLEPVPRPPQLVRVPRTPRLPPGPAARLLLRRVRSRVTRQWAPL